MTSADYFMNHPGQRGGTGTMSLFGIGFALFLSQAEPNLACLANDVRSGNVGYEHAEMDAILHRERLAPSIYELIIQAPRIARTAQPGQFVIVMPDERGERIPLSIADFDRQRGTITVVLMVVGTTSHKISCLRVGESLHALMGPLGNPSDIEHVGTVVMVAGGVGAAPVYPIARAFHQVGCRVITIQGARNKQLLFWIDRLSAVSDEHIITTDDGSAGQKGLVTEPLEKTLREDRARCIHRVFAIGPAAMMKFCSLTTKPFSVRTTVSLNTLMIDGTGMCGGCRVRVGEETRFTCVDGPEFDGHRVDWDLMLSRQNIYVKEEKRSSKRYAMQDSQS
jgi:ferredoxin--NADP+ reductase